MNKLLEPLYVLGDITFVMPFQIWNQSTIMYSIIIFSQMVVL